MAEAGTLLLCHDARTPWPILEHSVTLILTSPPYWNVRDYSASAQLGLEATPEAYIESLAAVFDEAHRVLDHDGYLAIVIGDVYLGSGGMEGCHVGAGAIERRDATHLAAHPSISLSRRAVDPRTWRKRKQLCLLPHRLAIALQNRDWILRNDIIWAKKILLPDGSTTGACKPLSQRSRWESAHEHILILQKPSSGDCFHWHAVATTHGSCPPDAWQLLPARNRYAHFAVYPEALCERLIRAYTVTGQRILDPFCGSGTTLAVAHRLGRLAAGFDINPSYVALTRTRLQEESR